MSAARDITRGVAGLLAVVAGLSFAILAGASAFAGDLVAAVLSGVTALVLFVIATMIWVRGG